MAAKHTVQLTSAEISTLKLALTGWIVRCKSEAKQMDDWAVDLDNRGDKETAEKCRRNAAASRAFQEEAEALSKSGVL